MQPFSFTEMITFDGVFHGCSHWATSKIPNKGGLRKRKKQLVDDQKGFVFIKTTEIHDIIPYYMGIKWNQHDILPKLLAFRYDQNFMGIHLRPCRWRSGKSRRKNHDFFAGKHRDLIGKNYNEEYQGCPIFFKDGRWFGTWNVSKVDFGAFMAVTGWKEEKYQRVLPLLGRLW